MSQSPSQSRSDPGTPSPSPRPATVAEQRYAEARERMRGRPPREVFEFIYQSNLWGSAESVSGLGSQQDATARIRASLPGLLKQLGVRTLLDLPCGDFSWLSATELPIDRYLGGDLVADLVERNRARTRETHPWAEFRVLDLTSDPLPPADALLCRDCLVHLPFDAIFRALRNLAASPVRWAILTTFVGDRENRDIETGDWRPLNLERPPFRLPPPHLVVLEECPENDGAYADKALGVWEVDQIRKALEEPAARP